MSESSDRLEEELAEINRRFADHPQISIVSTDGSPVNQYVIEYKLNGLVQLDDGEVVESDQHRIELSLSFGFPHFPPNCKPLTKIFHPDMDPSAIKIAEFWADSTSLADLIIQIGKMVCWEIYSSEDGFNQAALDWLQEHKDSVPMDTLQIGGGAVAAELPDVNLDLDLSGDLGAESAEFDLSLTDEAESKPEVSFVDDLDFNFAASEEVAEPSNELSLDLEESPPIDLDLGLDDLAESPPESSFGDDLEFDFNVSSSPDEVELSLSDTESDDAPLTLSLENENIEPVTDEDFSFVTAGDDPLPEESGVDVAPAEPDFSPSFPVEDVAGVDLDLAAVDVDYDILRGMVDQRNYIAAQKKLAAMPADNLSTATSALQPMIEQRIEQANGVYEQAKKLEDEGNLEDAANKLEAVLNLVQDYPNLDGDMKRVRDAFAGVGAGSNLGLERPDVPEVRETQVRDMMTTETGVTPVTPEPSDPVGTAQKKTPEKKVKPKKKKGDSVVKKNKGLIIAVLVLFLGLGVAGWCYVEWQAFSEADQKWAQINSLLEKDEYEKAQQECLDIRSLLARVKIIKGGGKKELLAQVDDLLKSEHFHEGLDGKILWQGEYISKKAHVAYEDINDLVEEAERRGALSKWQESADLYKKAFQIAKDNQQRLSEKFYTALELDVKNAQFANLVSLGKKYFISTQWPLAIKKFEAALQLAREDGVADPSTSYDVNRYLQRAWFSQYVIDGDAALRSDDFSTASAKFTKAYAIAKDPNLIDEQNRNEVLVKLNQSSLIKIMDDAEGYVDGKQWPKAVKAYKQAKKYTMDGYPLIDMGITESQTKVEGFLVSASISMEREIAARKRGAKQYVAAEAALERVLTMIDQSSLRDKPAIQEVRRKIVAEKSAVHVKAIVDEKIVYLQKHYRQIVVDNFTGVSSKALSNVIIDYLGEQDRALQFKIQCREQRESKYYTLELIYQYDIDLDLWGFPEM